MAEPNDQGVAATSAAASQEGGGISAPPLPPAAAPPAEAAPPASPPAGEPAAAAATPPAAAAASTPEPERTPTLLEKFDADKKAAEDKAAAEKAKKPADPLPGEAKPADAKPADAAKPADGEKKPDEAAKPAEAAAPAPVEYKYTLPEAVKMDDALKGKVHTALDEFRANPAEGAQKLIDLHAEQMNAFAQKYAEETLQNQYKVFNDTKAGWEKDILGDRELGGAGHQTAMQAAARVRDLGVSSARPGTPRYESEMKSFNEFLAVTGAGSHPAFVRLLHNLARFVDEPQFSSLPANIKPPPGNGRATGNRRAALYDHPSSQTRS